MKDQDNQKRELRITTWNVNGIRNPFGYQPWRQERTFSAMFEILEADIVVMQETKIQRKDLQDDMVLVPGWDVFFSLPKHKKGYSGVAIYTRNSVCAPIRAEEGITGVLTPPNSTTSFRDLPEDQQIGGYPTGIQLSDCDLDAATLDSEGRCVILEFPAFVLIGTYCPATRDESRDEFRIGFLNALDARVRNLVAAGKRVFLTGDLNIIREEMDTAKVEEQLKKQGVTLEEYFSSPARRRLNQLLVGGKVYGERDEGREKSVMWDICRSFHPTRTGMFTCWEQKINARPGNFGARIDYVLCSEDWKDWFCESNIQEGLLGSDHCPVYAVLKEKVNIDGEEVYTRDVMSSGFFKDGVRQRDWSAKDLLPMSAKLIPEFDRRRSIRDMFSKKPSLSKADSSMSTIQEENRDGSSITQTRLISDEETVAESVQPLGGLKVDTPSTNALSTGDLKAPTSHSMQSPTKPTKRLIESFSSARPQKRGKSTATMKSTGGKGQAGKGQSSLTGFFKPKTQQPEIQAPPTVDAESDTASFADSAPLKSPTPARSEKEVFSASQSFENESPSKPFNLAEQKDVVDPIVSKESWSKLLGKRVVPRCDHNEPCISLVTKKPGPNCGRSFYMCPRPIGPSGQKEKNSQWRCGTFIWSSDWTGDGT
ncbi:related to APN2-AP endonuclease, exonuclease III homolog [Rhynchosporium agropyri]|uniref:DNA-(apurinic or apyrimidinic site) endonuclease 2 n=1 Tax=Rhynchosporium agropyri TaxID=914238 RepID=A0A1E1KJI1_9HELO|nr:related to APN2-AP endonuclease, exonuclease III homolog [Rhynchosporium agropyri]